MSNHTKEPWSARSRNIPIADTGDYDGVVEILDSKGNMLFYAFDPEEDIREHDAERAVSCVNACAPFKDPKTEIAKLRADNKEMLEALKATREQLKKLQPITLPNQEIKYHISDGLFLVIKNMEEK